MPTLLLVSLCVLLTMGCARVRVEAPKDPIKVDVTMRLDIYQHIEKDIDEIEDMISGPATKAAGKDLQGFMDMIISKAHAEDGLAPEVQEAVMRRKDRRADLVTLEAQGVLGENRAGLIEMRGAGNDLAKAILAAENSDRMVIYAAVADKNGSSVDEVQKIYAKRLQSDAPAGAPIEGPSGWTIK